MYSFPALSDGPGSARGEQRLLQLSLGFPPNDSLYRHRPLVAAVLWRLGLPQPNCSAEKAV